MNTEFNINTIADELLHTASLFESRNNSGVLILPHAYRDIANQVIVRLVACTDNCGLIGNKLHNARKQTRLGLLFEDEIHAVYGDVYLLDIGHYNSKPAIEEAARYASGFGKYPIFISKQTQPKTTQETNDE